MITHQRNVYKWEFIFLGANIDALETADTLGISRHMSKTYTASPEGCRSTYMVMEKLLDYMKMNDSSSEDYESDCESILSEIDWLFKALLSKIKEHFIDFIQVIDLIFQHKLNDQITFAASVKTITRQGEEILSLLQIQL